MAETIHINYIMSHISKWHSQPLKQKETQDQNLIDTQPYGLSDCDTKIPLSESLDTCQTSDQSYYDDISIQQGHFSKEIQIKYLSSQSASIYQSEEELSGTIQIKQNQENKIILFLTQFIEKAIISNYLKNKITTQTYLLINKGRELAITEDIILKLLTSKNGGQISNIIQKEAKLLDLINVSSQITETSELNRSALINMFKAKYFSKTNAFLWRFQSEIDFNALQKDFNAHNIKVYLLDKNMICFVNQDEKPENVSYKNYKDDLKQQEIVKNSNKYEDITKIQTIWFNQSIFDKARFGKTQKFKTLLKLLLKYGNKIQVTQKMSINNQIKLDLYLNFYKKDDLVYFVKQLYSNQFELTQQGELKPSKMEDQQLILQHNYTPPQPGIDSNNVQGQQISLQSRTFSNEISIRSIMKATTCLKEFQLWDFLFLWNNGFKQVVQKLIKDWDVYRVQFQQPVRYLNRLAEYKMQKLKLKEIEIYQQIFKDIIQTVQIFIKVLGIQKLSVLLEKASLEGKKYSITYQQKDDRELLKMQKQQRLKIFQQLQSIKAQSRIEQVIDSYIYHKKSSNRDLAFITKIEENRKQSFSQYVAEKSSQSLQSNKLRNIITIVNYYLEQNNNLSVSKDAKAQKPCSETNQSYLTVIEEERVVETRCLGCATFFKMNTNIFDDTVNITPFKVFPSVQQMKEYQSQIKDQICSMLNSGGGIILFDCIHHFQKIFTKGIALNEKSKEQYEQRFTSYLDTFQPKKNIKRCIDIKFVPVVAEQPYRQNNSIMHQSYAGEQSLLKQNQTYRLRPFLRNVYVMRIRICPIQGQRVYFWNQNNDKEQKEINKSYLFTAVKDGVKTSIKMSKIACFIKQKMRKYYLPQKYKGDVRMCLQTPISSFNHQCRDPEASIGICHEQSDDIMSSDLRESSVSNNLSVDKYINSSLLIAKKQHFNEIKRRLKQEGFQCQIQQKFQQYKFQSAKNSAVLHYNKKFEDILKKVLQNPRFNFNGRKLILINITNYVKLSIRNEDTPYPLQDYQNLKEWLRKEFPQEQLKLYQFRCTQKKKIEYYLQTQTIDSTLFIYYILNKYKEKATFKNPLHLDKMDQHQRNERFKEIYNNNIQSNHEQTKENLKAQQFLPNDLNKSTRVQSDLS